MLRNFGVTGLVATLMGAFVLALQGLSPTVQQSPEVSASATDSQVGQSDGAPAAGAMIAQSPAPGQTQPQGPAAAAPMTAQQQAGPSGGSQVQNQSGTTWPPGPMMGRAQPGPMMGQMQPPRMKMGMMGMCGRMMRMMMGGMSQTNQGGQMNQAATANQPSGTMQQTPPPQNQPRATSATPTTARAGGQ